MGDAAAVAAAVAAAQQVESQRIPLFYGDEQKDIFDADTWLSRIRAAQRQADWNEERTHAVAETGLRGNALRWYMVTKERPGVNVDTWPTFQTAFKAAF